MSVEKIEQTQKIGQLTITVTRHNPSLSKIEEWSDFLSSLLLYLENHFCGISLEYPEEE